MVAFDLQTSPSAYVLGRSLGEGTFGKVCSATRRCDGSVVALKYFRDATCHAEISLEIALCAMLMVAEPASQHIVKLTDVFRDSAHTVLAMEHGGRTVKDAIESGVFRETTGLLLCDVISQLAAGLRHIHANGVIHSDLSYKAVSCLFPVRGAPREGQVHIPTLHPPTTPTNQGKSVGNHQKLSPDPPGLKAQKAKLPQEHFVG